MSSNPGSPERVEPAIYTDNYYLTNCHGFEDFVVSGGRRVGSRFVKALALAGDLSGKRVLDVGCGRGELIIQSAMRGAEAWGIDYAPAAVEIASRALSGVDVRIREHTQVEQMDIKALTFEDGFFDVVFFMDVVEHLYPHELSLAFDELRRTMKPGGLLVMHTSPNKIFEERVYPLYSRHINVLALTIAEKFEIKNDLFNKLMLPTAKEFPRNKYERAMHINEQSAPRLAAEVTRHGFSVRTTQFWEPQYRGGYFRSPALNAWLRVLDFVRFFRPFSYYPPLNRWFCNHIWMTAVRD